MQLPLSPEMIHFNKKVVSNKRDSETCEYTCSKWATHELLYAFNTQIIINEVVNYNIKNNP